MAALKESLMLRSYLLVAKTEHSVDKKDGKAKRWSPISKNKL